MTTSVRPALRTVVRPIGPAWVRTFLPPLLLYLVLAVVLTAPAWTSPGARWIGGCCDPQQTMWFLAWIPYAVEHLTDPFVTGQLNAPAGANLMWSTSIPLISFIAAPLTLTAGPIVAYNVAIVASIAFSAWCAFLVLRRYAAGRVAAIVGGLVYGFSPYVVSHAALHLDLTAVWAPPLFLLLLDEIVVRRRRSPHVLGVLVGLLAACQLLTAEEHLATSAIAAAVLLVILAAVVSAPRAHLIASGRRLVEATVVASATFLIVAAWPLAVQFLGPQRISGRVGNVERFSTDLLNLVVPTQFQLVAPDAARQASGHFSGLAHEATAYLGLPLLVLVVVAVVVKWDDLRVRVAGLVALAMFVLSLGPRLHVGGSPTEWLLPWSLVVDLPLVEDVLPGRLTLYMWLAVAVIVTVVVQDALDRRGRRGAGILAACALALAVCAPAPLGTSTTETPPFFSRWGQQGIAAERIVLFAPWFRNGAGAAPMIWAAVAGDAPRMYEAYAFVPGEDGTASYGPPSTQLSRIMETIQDRGVTLVASGEVRAQVARDLQAVPISHVIIGPMQNREQMVVFFTDLFGRPPLEVDGVQIWRDVDRFGVVPRP